MKKYFLACIMLTVIVSCTKEKSNQAIINQTTMNQKHINNNLPTIGILLFEGVIVNEVIAPLDVFSNTNADGEELFNVIMIAKENKTYKTAHGLKIQPDYIIGEVPKLSVLVVPSSYTPESQTSDEVLVNFIKEQHKQTEYIASHCAGAFLLGESGIVDDKEIVTYVTGGEVLQATYPNLKVADDSKVSVVHDGKIISSNGSLVSYIASFDLLEKMTDEIHREYVEEIILFNRLQEN